MKTDRYPRMFAAARREGRGVFVPFLVIGDPDPQGFLRLARAALEGGADALELGIAYSDPVADGPTIQAAARRAIHSGVTFAVAMDLVGVLRREVPSVPLGLLAYAGTVWGVGVDAFVTRAARAGVDSVLVADLPIAEATPYLAAARGTDLGTVFIAPPGLDNRRLRAIASACDGFTYVVSRGGVTGVDRGLGQTFARLIERLEQAGAPPPMVGFGISTPDHVRAVLDAGAAGAISGSAVVGLHAGAADREVVGRIRNFVGAMKDATFGMNARQAGRS